MASNPSIPIAAFEQFGSAPFFVFCDHASNAIPADMDCLGLPSDILQTHIAWDIGAGALSRALCQRLGGQLFECGFSRLIIDVNRDFTSDDLIPAVSDQIPVPGNQMLTDTEKRRRVNAFHEPYHRQLAAALNEATQAHKELFVISVHSFTNRLMGSAQDRPWPIGLLWRDDEQSAHAAISYLAGKTNWLIGDNEPYDARVFNYSVDKHISPRGLRHLTLEVRQDKLGDDYDVAIMADIIAEAVHFASKPHVDIGDIL